METRLEHSKAWPMEDAKLVGRDWRRGACPFFRGVLLGRECGFDLDESDGQQASALADTQRPAAGDGNQSGGQPLLP